MLRGRIGFTFVAAHAFAFQGFDARITPKDQHVAWSATVANEQLPRWTPFIPRDWPGLAWRTRGAENVTENELGTIVIDAAIEVHRTLGGPGLLEGVYEEALAFELRLRGLEVRRSSLNLSSSTARQPHGITRSSNLRCSPTCGCWT